MPLVSISEAARLTGKNRSTLHRHIQQGKLSKTIDETGESKIDTSEILRVYGAFIGVTKEHDATFSIQQQATSETVLLQQEILHLKEMLQMKDNLLAEKERIIMFLEDKSTTENNVAKPVAIQRQKKWWQIFK